jgi:hypothetical protein
MEPYIYKIIDLNINKVVYVGQTNGNNKKYKGSSLILMRYRKKYGTVNYEKRFKLEKIKHCLKEQLNDEERFWIKYYDTFNNGLNLTEGGTDVLYKTILGKTFPEKSKKLKGIKRSSETIELLKKAKKGFIPSELCFINGILARMKKVLQYDLKGNFMKEWESISQIETTLNIHKSLISDCCLGKQKTAKGYLWIFKTNENYPLKINPPSRKPRKKLPTSGRAMPIEIEGIKYLSIKQAYETLNISEQKMRSLIKNKKIKFKWL